MDQCACNVGDQCNTQSVNKDRRWRRCSFILLVFLFNQTQLDNVTPNYFLLTNCYNCLLHAHGTHATHLPRLSNEQAKRHTRVSVLKFLVKLIDNDNAVSSSGFPYCAAATICNQMDLLHHHQHMH